MFTAFGKILMHFNAQWENPYAFQRIKWENPYAFQRLEWENPYAFQRIESGESGLTKTFTKGFTSHGCEKAGVDSHVLKKIQGEGYTKHN